jgi:hypothetical protein
MIQRIAAIETRCYLNEKMLDSEVYIKISVYQCINNVILSKPTVAVDPGTSSPPSSDDTGTV